jgi:predicted aldo/keto reductase-like oxidoreductase
MTTNNNNGISRRTAIKYFGAAAVGTAAVLAGCKPSKEEVENATIVGVTKRKDKHSDAEVSLLGFGCMRLPLTDTNDRGSIDEPLAAEMIDYAYKHGVNYFDTAWMYHNGNSEPFVGKTLKKYPRESFYLATKMPTPCILGEDPTGLVKSSEPLERIKEIFQHQLNRCQVEYVDFYLLHSLKSDAQFVEAYKDTGGFDYLLTEKDNGRIKRLGFSFHGPKEELPLLADRYKWDFCMIQDNYYDWEIDGEYLYNELDKRGIQAIFMEPIRGGMLATLSPAAVKVFEASNAERSPASWALQWCASLPNVLTILSGMSKPEHVKDNVNTFTDFKPMTDAERNIVAEALATYKLISPIPCTECDYCVSPPCPAGINISQVFAVYNECVADDNVPNMALARVSGKANSSDLERQKRVFKGRMNKIPQKMHAERCTACNECLPKCPQSINITENMQSIAKIMKEIG